MLNIQRHFYLGYCHEKLGNVKKALRAYKTAMTLKPDYGKPERHISILVGEVVIDFVKYKSKNCWIILEKRRKMTIILELI
ncbi:MAG: tetratricopeptide repeat protein [Actinomycetota bacterium]